MLEVRPRLRTLEPDTGNRLYQTLLESTLAGASVDDQDGWLLWR